MEVKIFNDNKIWYYRVKREDERFENGDFLKRFNFSYDDFMNLNPEFTGLTAGRILIMPPSAKYYHIVGPLESYDTIARSYNCSAEKLKEINKSNSLFIGQRIFID